MPRSSDHPLRPASRRVSTGQHSAGASSEQAPAGASLRRARCSSCCSCLIRHQLSSPFFRDSRTIVWIACRDCPGLPLIIIITALDSGAAGVGSCWNFVFDMETGKPPLLRPLSVREPPKKWRSTSVSSLRPTPQQHDLRSTTPRRPESRTNHNAHSPYIQSGDRDAGRVLYGASQNRPGCQQVPADASLCQQRHCRGRQVHPGLLVRTSLPSGKLT